jgi:hypothetical protein
MAKLVARLPATATLWVRIKTSLRNTKWRHHISKGVANTLQPAKNIPKKLLTLGTKLTKTSARTDTTLVDEAFSFLEQNRVTIRPERDDFSDSVAEFMQRNRLKINLQAAHPYFLFPSSCGPIVFILKNYFMKDIASLQGSLRMV